jgi:glycosyltransferase involved in cell wall biosynthesis
VKNLLQGIQSLDASWDIKVHQVSRSELYGDNKLITAIEHTVDNFKLIKMIIDLRMKRQTDVLIIHKPLRRNPLDILFDINLTHDLILKNNPPYNVVCSTYDASYVHNPAADYLFRNSDLVFATSKTIHNRANKVATDTQIAKIPPSVDTSFFNPDVDIPDNLKTDKIVVGWVGNIEVHRSDMRIIVNSLQSLDSQDLLLRVLTGGGEIPSKLKKEIKAMQIDVDLIDYVPWSDVPAVINSFDIGLAPLTNTEFNRGRSSEKIREYMACGKPVVASNVGENPILIPDEAGFLVDSQGEWVNSILTLANDESKRQSMGNAARKHVCDKYSIPTIAGKIENELKRFC